MKLLGTSVLVAYILIMEYDQRINYDYKISIGVTGVYFISHD